MIIKFKKIRLKNFMSIGAVPIEFSYQSGINAIIAKEVNGTTNGQGKSVLGNDGLICTLYGKSIRGLNKDEIINNINGKECEMTLWLDIDKVPYRVERGIDPDYFRFINEKEEAVATEKMKEESSQKKTKQNIEDILGISYTSFINAITLNINYSAPFFKLKAHERRQVLEDILSLNVYGKMFETVKKEWNQYKTEKRSLESEYSNVKTMYADKKATYEKLEESRKRFEDEKHKNIIEIEKRIEDNNTNIRKNKERLAKAPDLNSVKMRVSDGKDKCQNLLSQLTSDMNVLERDIQQKIREIADIEKNPICPKCKTPVTTSEHTIQHIEKLNKEIVDAKKQIEQKRTEKAEKEPTLIAIKSKLKEIEDAIDKRKTLENEIENLISKNSIEQNSLDTEKQKTFSMGQIISQQDLDKLKTKVDRKSKEYNDNDIAMKYADYAKDILGDQGIKKYIIKKILPVLNKKTNEYLSLFQAKYTLNFDNELREKFRTRNSDNRTYGSFSAGEQKRIDLAFMFALLDIAKSQHSVDSNILILDEIIDSSLCANGIMHLMDFLKNVLQKTYPDLCVYIISHKAEIGEDNFNRIITIQKEQEFTKIESIREVEQVLQV